MIFLASQPMTSTAPMYSCSMNVHWSLDFQRQRNMPCPNAAPTPVTRTLIFMIIYHFEIIDLSI